MNFDDNPQEAAYRATVRAWIEANAPDMSVLAPEERRPWQDKHKAIATVWQATKADAGYACISWPKERGGAGGTAIQEAIFNQEEARAGVQFTYFMTGQHMLLPAVMKSGASSFRNRRAAPTPPPPAQWRCAMVTIGCSTAKRFGTAAHRHLIMAWSSLAPMRMCQSIRGYRHSGWI